MLSGLHSGLRFGSLRPLAFGRSGLGFCCGRGLGLAFGTGIAAAATLLGAGRTALFARLSGSMLGHDGEGSGALDSDLQGGLHFAVEAELNLIIAQGAD